MGTRTPAHGRTTRVQAPVSGRSYARKRAAVLRRGLTVRQGEPDHGLQGSTDLAIGLDGTDEDLRASAGGLSSPVDPWSDDLVRIGLALHAAEYAWSREREASDGRRWTHCTAPVRCVDSWQTLEPQLAEALYVLSGGAYVFEFVERVPGTGDPPAVSSTPAPRGGADAAVLLSGGLDSFGSAVRSLTEGRRLLLLACRDGNPATTVAQEHVARLLARRFPEATDLSVLSYRTLTPARPRPTATPPGSGCALDGTARLLQMALGVAACRAHGIGELLVPRCGHPPLHASSPEREASWCRSDSGGLVAIARLNEVLAAAGVPVAISNPCAYATKTGLIRKYLQPNFSPTEIRGTVSCLRAGHSAWPCGQCTKCLLRSVAMAAADLQPERHAVDPLAMDTQSRGSTNLLGLLRFTRDMRRAEASGTPPWFENLVYGVADVCPRRAMNMLRRLADEATIALHAVPPESP